MAKTFLSYSSKDKSRFVKEFAQALRANGVDVWFDEWELQAGDSIVDKIFEEGLRDAETFIVVLSKCSIESKWVKEELNAAVVNRIEGQCRVIPVVLDNAVVPASLKHLRRIDIPSSQHIQQTVDTVVRAIHGTTDRPPLGSIPAYIAEHTDSPVTELDSLEWEVLRRVCKCALDEQSSLVSTDKIIDVETTIPWSQLQEALEVLDHQAVIKIHRRCCSCQKGLAGHRVSPA